MWLARFTPASDGDGHLGNTQNVIRNADEYSREVKEKIWSNQIMTPGIVTICYKLGIIYLHLFYIILSAVS